MIQTKASLDTEPGPLTHSLLRLLRLSRLNAIVQGGVPYMPPALRAYIERERLRAQLRERRRAVPEAPFRDLLRRGIEELTARGRGEPLGDYLEFGVYNGTSLVAAYREFNGVGLNAVRFFGFDSFEGLPAAAATDDEGLWKPGDWRSDLAFTEAVLSSEGVDRQRVVLIPGWFSDTCTPETARRYGISRASVIMVDCDIYTSASEALAFCDPLIADRALVIFDDWHSGQLAAKNLGERRAFEEFLAARGGFQSEPFGSYNRKSEAFLVTRTGT